MSATLQALFVAIVVASALAYVAIRFFVRSLPGERRAVFAARAAGWARRSGLSNEGARRVEAKLASAGACGSCDSCRACASVPDGRDESPSFKGIPVRRSR